MGREHLFPPERGLEREKNEIVLLKCSVLVSSERYFDRALLRRDAKLPKRDRATRSVSKFLLLLCFTKCYS